MLSKLTLFPGQILMLNQVSGIGAKFCQRLFATVSGGKTKTLLEGHIAGRQIHFLTSSSIALCDHIQVLLIIFSPSLVNISLLYKCRKTTFSLLPLNLVICSGKHRCFVTVSFRLDSNSDFFVPIRTKRQVSLIQRVTIFGF